MSLRGGMATAASATSQSQVLVTMFGQTRLAFPVESIRGTLPHGVRDHQNTVSAYGLEFPLINLRDRFNLSRSDTQEKTQIILCASGEALGAIEVDDILGLVKLVRSQIRPLPAHFAGPEREWFQGLFFYQDTVALLISPAWLLQ